MTVATANARPICAYKRLATCLRSTHLLRRQRCRLVDHRRAVVAPGTSAPPQAWRAPSNASQQRTARSCFTSTGSVEVDAGRFLRRRRRFERHLGLGAVEDLGADGVREGADPGVIALHRLVIVAARSDDAVFGAFELVLKREEILVGLEVRIGFLKPLQRDDRLGQPALRLVERLNLRRIARDRSATELDPRRIGARLRSPAMRTLLFLLGIALHRVDQVRDEVGAALIIGLEVRPTWR